MRNSRLTHGLLGKGCPIHLLAILVGLTLLGLPPGVAPSSAQSQQPPAKPLQYDVAVTLKLIQVYVTDKDGKPVRDLTSTDFTLTDNGKPVTITAFERHDLAAAPAGAVAPVPEAVPVTEPATAPALSRKFVILFDFAFNTAHGIVAGVQAARHFLDTEARPGDELAFISYSTLKGLRIHEFLTTDHAKIRAALAQVTAKDIAGRADEVEQAYWMSVNNPGGEMHERTGMGMSSLEMSRQDSMQQAAEYLRKLTRLAQALRLVQGEKNVLFFSSGIPSSLINSVRRAGTANMNGMGSVEESNRGSTFDVGNSELRPLQETMLKEFSASSCSFYAFDTRESSKLPALFSYDEMAFLNRPSGGLLGSDSGGMFRDDRTTGMDSLRRLSKQTGGKYYSNISLHEKNLEEVSSVTGTYYVLGYPIRPAPDGQFHDIKVEVGRKGCQVRTQPGYFDPKPFREYTDIEKDIHLFDLALNERSEFQAPGVLPITALSYDGGQGARVRVLTRIPGDIWTRFGGQTLELVALFFDAQDSLLSLQRLALARADLGGKEIFFTAGTPARSGAIKCRIVLRDMDTGQSAVASTIAYVGPSNRQSLSVFTPLVLVEGGGLFHLEGVVKGKTESPAWRELYPYDQAAFSPVFGSEAVSAGRMGVILPYSAPGLGAADLVFRANVISSNGQNLAVPLELRGSTSQGTVEAQKLELSLKDVPNGVYTLYIHVGNKLSGSVVSARVPLTVGR
jgi:VWFA-related protein